MPATTVTTPAKPTKHTCGGTLTKIVRKGKRKLYGRGTRENRQSQTLIYDIGKAGTTEAEPNSSRGDDMSLCNASGDKPSSPREEGNQLCALVPPLVILDDTDDEGDEGQDSTPEAKPSSSRGEGMELVDDSGTVPDCSCEEGSVINLLDDDTDDESQDRTCEAEPNSSHSSTQAEEGCIALEISEAAMTPHEVGHSTFVAEWVQMRQCFGELYASECELATQASLTFTSACP